MSDFLAIAREPIYSPGKVEQDRAILEAVAQRLGARHTVRIVDPEEPFADPTPQMIVFAMCQGPAALARLREWENAGIRVVNSVRAIENCHRRRMLAAFEEIRAPYPESFMVATDSRLFACEVPSTRSKLPDWTNGSYWLKRGDVHAVQADDVVLLHNVDGLHDVLQRWRSRGIADALLQRHVDGEVIKFYGVRGGFFHWLPTTDGEIRLDAESEHALATLAWRGAEALGLEVYGGDCVRDRRGDFWLIDLNDWPSYAPCRTQAAGAIAAYLDAQTRAKPT